MVGGLVNGLCGQGWIESCWYQVRTREKFVRVPFRGLLASRAQMEIVGMTAKAATKTKSRDGDRRSGEDRRKVDVGPPGKRERRRSLESRKPDVLELEMTPSEWGALGHEPQPPSQ